MPRHVRDQQGFVLILVLWMVVLVALMAAAFSRATQSYIREVASRSRSAQAEAIADAGINLVALDLAAVRDAPRRSRRFPLDGGETACQLENAGALFIRVQDAGGKVNVNLADQRLLAALFIGLGATPEAATRYADRIIDFRDRDDDRRVSGAEREEYLVAGSLRGPKNASFEAFEELHQVLGLDASMIAAMEPFTTLHSGIAGLEPAATSAKLAALINHGVSQLPFSTAAGFTADGLPPEFTVASPRRIFVASVTARLEGGATFVRDAEIDVLPGRGALPAIKTWRRGRDDEDRGGSTDELPPC
ncbi:MAG: hypothetical protein WC807_05730 [Hyphomicrobium sp.]|jgi:general secretion pathway protein K